jgi:hypothetical protein
MGSSGSSGASAAAITAAIAATAKPLKGSSNGLANATASRYESYSGNITVGQCMLQGSPVTIDLVVVLESSIDNASTWQTVQSLTIPAGTTIPVSHNPNAAITGPVLLRFHATSTGGGTDWYYEAQVVG